MKRDKLVNFRVNSAQYEEIKRLAKERKLTVSAFLKEAITATAEGSYRVELERNREYHKLVLESLDRIGGKMRRKRKQPAT